MIKYVLVSACGCGMGLSMSHTEFNDLESLKKYLFDECYYDEDNYEALLNGGTVVDTDNETWDKLIEINLE